MYAIVDIAGQQFKVEAGKKIYVHRLKEEAGASVSFDKVLLYAMIKDHPVFILQFLHLTKIDSHAIF